MKKVKSILFSLILLIFISSNVIAAKSPEIQYNGKIVKSDVAPFIRDNRTLVPIRFISETLGYHVIKLNKINSVQKPDDDMVREEAKKELMRQKQLEHYKKVVEELKKKTKVEILV